MWQMVFVISSSKDTGHQQVFRMRYATQRMAALGMLLPKRVAGDLICHGLLSTVVVQSVNTSVIQVYKHPFLLEFASHVICPREHALLSSLNALF